MDIRSCRLTSAAPIRPPVNCRHNVTNPRCISALIGSAAAPDATIATLETDEQSARRIAGLFAESFAPTMSPSALSDAGRGSWRVALYFAPPTTRRRCALWRRSPAHAAAAALRFERVAAKDWVAREPRRTEAGRGRPLHRARRARPRRHCAQPHRHRDRSGARLRHRPSRHHARLPAGARPPVQVVARRQGRAAHSRSRHRLGRARHRRRPRVCAGACWQPTSMRLRCAWRAPTPGSTASAPLVALVQADGVTAPAIRARAPFDLVFANILLEPLQRLAAPLTKIVAPGGRVVLSGLLTAQANAALAAYRALRLERRIELDGWTTLVLRRGRSAARAVARCRRRPIDCPHVRGAFPIVRGSRRARRQRAAARGACGRS